LLTSGRLHGYEGYLSAFVGCKYLFCTNAAGGGLAGMGIGSFMLLSDHFNYTSKTAMPAINNDPRFESRVIDQKNLYSPYLRDLAFSAAKEQEFELLEGVYNMCLGPNYETPVDTAWLRKQGIGAFGMSTVPEVLAGKSLGMEVMAVSLITNLCAGLQSKLTHSEVAEAANEAGPRMQAFISHIIKNID
jgi:purine-nucleoside phosphorylase